MAQKLSEGIERFQNERAMRNMRLVRQTINELEMENQPVSFRSVARKSGIGKSTLYRNQALRTLVEAARESGASLREPESIMVRLSELEREVIELREPAMRASGVAYAEIDF